MKRTAGRAAKPIDDPAMTPLDQRAKKILFDTYWTSKGWIDDHASRLQPAT